MAENEVAARPGVDEGNREPASTAIQEPVKEDGSPSALPVLTRIGGVDFIAVPLTHYRELLAGTGLAEAGRDGSRNRLPLLAGAATAWPVASSEAYPVPTSLPLSVTVFDQPCVCIPEGLYQELIEHRPGQDRRVYRLSRMDKDEEVRAFVEARMGRVDLGDIRRAAIEHFGADRVPSRSAFSRFAVAWRERSEKDIG